MPRMVITHAVVEIDRWLQGKAERVDIIGKYATNVTDTWPRMAAITSPSPPTSTTWRACRS